jgi:hypothetical protein
MTVGRPHPLAAGEGLAHMHFDDQNNSIGSVPGSGDNNFPGQTAWMITRTHAFAMDRFSNGTYRTRVLSGPPLTNAQRSELVASERNWESGNSSNSNLTENARFCPH